MWAIWKFVEKILGKWEIEVRNNTLSQWEKQINWKILGRVKSKKLIIIRNEWIISDYIEIKSVIIKLMGRFD